MNTIDVLKEQMEQELVRKSLLASGIFNEEYAELAATLSGTSVDHGTALTLAGTGLAEVGSLQAAVQEAIHMINARSNITMSNTP